MSVLLADVIIIVQIREIVKLAPRDRQTMLFSATMTEDVQKLVSVSLRSPVRLAADAAGQVPDGLLQEIIRLKVRTYVPSMTQFNPHVILWCKCWMQMQ